ncbi:MAG: hypothetical protein KAX20_05670 [Candidatus Omnitrophica bacterium]|nr:hypothetical protein [Candidatus Omnitrophota bacterium]
MLMPGQIIGKIRNTIRNGKMCGYRCEYCRSTVREQLVKKEVFKHKTGFVILEEIPVGHLG